MVLYVKQRTRSERKRLHRLVRDDNRKSLASPADTPDQAIRQLRQAVSGLQDRQLVNLKPILPLMFRLRGKPYHIRDHFPFEPFFSIQLPRRLAMKTGRQVSKTVHPYTTTVYDTVGRRRRIADMRVGDRVLSIDEDPAKVVSRKVTAIHESPPKPCFRITTRKGVVLELAATHPLRKLSGWTTAGELQVKDRIAHAAVGGRFDNKRQRNDRVKLTAYMIGDGCCGCSGQWSFHSSEGTNAFAEFCDLASELQELPLNLRHRRNGGRGVSCRLQWDNQLVQWLLEDDLDSRYSYEKRVPGWVFELPREQTISFIERLWSTDGMVKYDKTKPQISYSTASRELAFDLKSLLLKFGIPVSIKQRKAGYCNDGGEHVACRDAYIVRVETRQGWQTFLDTFRVPDKPGFELQDVVSNNNRDTVPIEVGEIIAELAGECRGTGSPALHQVGLRKKPKYAMTYEKLDRYVAFFQKYKPNHPRLHELERLLEGDLIWDEIVQIEKLGERPCCDIEVEETHNYLIEGILSHNSTSQASQGVAISVCNPYFNTLFVTPLFEMIRRFSANYVRGFIDESPVKHLWCDSTTSNNVLQRSFTNRSTMFFSFAFLNADRTRGLNCDKVGYDEVQDLDPAFIPIIREVMSGSVLGGLEQFTGTPKTLDNTVEQLWLQSSQGEWMIRCEACNKENYPRLDLDLDAMIGPNIVKREVSPRFPGIVCAKCGRPIDPRNGRWVHFNPELRYEFAGYHVPQIIMPMHYADSEKWSILLGKRQGFGNTPVNVFYNEVCGESYDTGAKLVTVTDLKQAAVLGENERDATKHDLGQYVRRVCAVDWGGGGQDGNSFTTVAVLGLLPSGKIDVLYGWRSLSPHDHNREVREILHCLADFNCSHLVHDYSGAGNVRETLLVNSGFPVHRILPVAYVRSAKGPLMRLIEYNERTGERQHYRVDKARSLVLTCSLIRYGFLRFFQYDYKGPGQAGLLHDFLSLTEDKVDSRIGSDIYTVIRNEKIGPDDFAQSVNIGSCALYYQQGRWPNISEVAQIQADVAALQAIHPEDEIDWGDI